MAFVASKCVALLGDLVSSRAAADRRALHDELVAALELQNAALTPLHPLRVTVGDEFQGVFATLGGALGAAYGVRLALAEASDVRFGFGRGRVETVDAAAGIQDGSAWWAARDAIVAVEALASQAAQASRRMLVRSAPDEPSPAPELSAALASVDAMMARLDHRSLRILAGLLRGVTQRDLAAAEGVSATAVSQRVRRESLEVLAGALTDLGRAA